MACKYLYNDKWYSEDEILKILASKKITIEDVLLEFSSSITFPVEMNVAIDTTKKNPIISKIENDDYEYSYQDDEDFGKIIEENYLDTNLPYEELKQQVLNILYQKLGKGKNEPTQQHINLSARNNQNTSKYEGSPDWSYKEIQINTPLIEPSIKGHTAPFDNANGIGWIRVWTNEKTGEVEVQEIQSDLFQKGRTNGRALAWNRYLLDNKGDVIGENPNFQSEQDFLNLLLKDNNWVNFFIKATIQYFAKQQIITTSPKDVHNKIMELQYSKDLIIDCD